MYYPAQNAGGLGDCNKNIYSRGLPKSLFLLRVRVPISVGYGTCDAGAVANDLCHEAIRYRKTNFTLRAYPGREHNFFGVKEEQVCHENFH